MDSGKTSAFEAHRSNADRAAARTNRLGPAERRYCFAVWPQAVAHPSWLEALDVQTGLALSRHCDHRVGAQEQGIAHWLLQQVGADLTDRVADSWLPAWTLLDHAAMRQHLSTLAATILAPSLRRTVDASLLRRWDAVLGPGVRRAALLLMRAIPEPDRLALEALRPPALAALQDSRAWDAFCLALGLAALQPHPAGVQARVRLMWPREHANLRPLALDPQRLGCLARFSEQGTHLQGAAEELAA